MQTAEILHLGKLAVARISAAPPTDRESGCPSLQSGLASWSPLIHRMWHMWPCVIPQLCLNKSDSFHLHCLGCCPQTDNGAPGGREALKILQKENHGLQWTASPSARHVSEVTFDLQLSWLSSSGVGKPQPVDQIWPSACFFVGPLSYE